MKYEDNMSLEIRWSCKQQPPEEQRENCTGFTSADSEWNSFDQPCRINSGLTDDRRPQQCLPVHNTRKCVRALGEKCDFFTGVPFFAFNVDLLFDFQS